MGKRYTKGDVKNQLNNIRLTEKQQKLLNLIKDNNIIISTGPAGTAKTFVACYSAIKMLNEGHFDKIIFTKPIQEAGEKLGHLPGGVNEKIDPYMESYVHTLKKIVQEDYLHHWMDTGIIEFKPLAYMRGATFDNCLMVLDEAQNCTMKQIMLYVTRMGYESKVLLTGDISQYDISEKHVGLPKFAELVEGIPGVVEHKFSNEDIVRNKILVEITDRYEKFKYENS